MNVKLSSNIFIDWNEKCVWENNILISDLKWGGGLCRVGNLHKPTFVGYVGGDSE